MADSVVLNYSNPEHSEEVQAEEDAGIISPPPTTAAYRSVCTPSTAKIAANRFKVPPELGLCAPAADQTADSPPPGYATISTHHFRYGLRLPLPPFVVSVLDHYRIALAQLHPHSVIYILGFLEVCKRASIDPSLTLFRHFFQLRRCPNVKEMCYIFTQTPRLKIVWGVPLSGSRWKTYFLFFKTAPMKESGVFSWNHSPIVDEPVAADKRPSAETVDRLLANAFEYQPPLAFQGERLINELDVPVASLTESCSSNKKTEKTMNASTEKNGRLKRTAEPLATRPAKARRGQTGKKCVGESSLVLSVPSLKDKDTESEIPLLEGHIDELEKVMAAKGQGCQDKDSEISSLQGRLEELEKVMAAKEQVFKDKDSEIASLQGRVEELEKGMVAKEQVFKDKDNEIALLQGRLEELEKVLVAKEQDVEAKDIEILMLYGDKDELEKAVVAVERRVKDKEMEISSIQGDKKGLEKVVVDMEREINLLQGHLEEMRKALEVTEHNVKDKDKEIALLKYENSKFKSVRNDKIPSSSQLKDLHVDEDQNALIPPRRLYMPINSFQVTNK